MIELNLDYLKTILGGYSRNTFHISLFERRLVQTCVSCNGLGKTSETSISNYHKNEYDTVYTDCKSCAGDGRVIDITVFADFGEVPYKPSTHGAKNKAIKIENYAIPYDPQKIKDLCEYSEKKHFYLPFDASGI